MTVAGAAGRQPVAYAPLEPGCYTVRHIPNSGAGSDVTDPRTARLAAPGPPVGTKGAVPTARSADMEATIMGPLGGPEIFMILLIVIILFGVGKLGDIGGAMGKSIREFKKSVTDEAAPAAPAETKAEETPSA